MVSTSSSLPPSVFNCVGAALFSPVATYNDGRVCHVRCGGRADEEQKSSVTTRTMATGPPSVSGWAPPARRSTTETASADLELTANARLRVHRLFQSVGSGRSTARPGQWTALAADWLLAEDGSHGVSVHADSIALGDYRRRYEPTVDAPGTRTAGDGCWHVGSSYDYASRALPVHWDRVMSVGIAGPMFELTAKRGEVALRAEVALYYGFAQVSSLAYAEVADSLAGQAIRTVLRRQGYYYAHAVLPSADRGRELGARSAERGLSGRRILVDRPRRFPPEPAHESVFTARRPPSLAAGRSACSPTAVPSVSRWRSSTPFGIAPCRGAPSPRVPRPSEP